jgi:hypothetical protein
MKRTVLTIATALIGFASSAVAETLEANIPFTFQIGSVTLPAGTYQVIRNPSSPVFTLRNIAARTSAVEMMPIAGLSASSPKLTFTRDGSAYRLTEVCSANCQSSAKHLRPTNPGPVQVASVPLLRPSM